MTKEEIRQELEALYPQITDLREQLKSKDYIGVKIAMGVARKTDYTAEITQTEEWCAELNVKMARRDELLAMLAEVNNEPEEEGAE